MLIIVVDGNPRLIFLDTIVENLQRDTPDTVLFPLIRIISMLIMSIIITITIVRLHRDIVTVVVRSLLDLIITIGRDTFPVRLRRRPPLGVRRRILPFLAVRPPRVSRFSDITPAVSVESRSNTDISVDAQLNYVQIAENINCLSSSRRQQKRHNREVMECESTTTDRVESKRVALNVSIECC
jgi:hypothetical protein